MHNSNNIDSKKVISVEPVCLINVTSSVAIVHQYVQLTVHFPEARSLAFLNIYLT